MPESAKSTMIDDLILLRRHRKLMNEVFKRHGLSTRDGTVLITLAERANSQREVARLLNLFYPYVSDAVASCEEKGLLVQVVNENDGRRKLVTLTNKGLDLVSSLKQAWREEV